MIVGALLAWGRQRPFVTSHEAAIARAAILRADRHQPIVVLVDDPDASATFLGARAANILRAASSPDRAEDVHVVVGGVTDFFEGRPTTRGDPQYDALARLTFEDATQDLHAQVVVLEPFYRGVDLGDARELSELEPRFVVVAESAGSHRGGGGEVLAFGPSSPGGIAVATIGILVVLTVLGLGYARASFDDRAVVLGTAPAFGAASLSSSRYSWTG